MPPINDQPFVQLLGASTIQTLKVQCNLPISPKPTFFKGDQKQVPFEIGGIIGLTTPTLHGSVALCFPKAVFLKLLHNLHGELIQEITVENEDAAAELLNIIFTHAKILLKKEGHPIDMAIPSILRGTGVESSYAKDQKVHVLPFVTEQGEFYLELLLQEKKVEPEAPAPQGTQPQKAPGQMGGPEKAAFFAPFLNGTVQTLKMQFGIDSKMGKPYEKKDSADYDFDIAAVIGITSKVVSGSFMLSFKREPFFKLASKIFDESIAYFQPGTDDCIAEIVNMAMGVAKTRLNEQGHGIQMAIPTVVRGTTIRSSHKKGRTTLVMPFESDIGPFHAEINFD